LFVSHNMAAVQNLCDRVVWMENGAIRMEGPANDVAIEYLGSTVLDENELIWSDAESAPGNEHVRLRRIAVKPADDTCFRQIGRNTPLDVTVEYWQLRADDLLDVNLRVIYAPNTIAFSSNSSRHDSRSTCTRGLHRAICRIPGNLLNDGPYVVNLAIARNRSETCYAHPEKLTFHVHDTEVRHGGYFGKRAGVVQPILDWNMEQIEDAAS